MNVALLCARLHLANPAFPLATEAGDRRQTEMSGKPEGFVHEWNPIGCEHQHFGVNKNSPSNLDGLCYYQCNLPSRFSLDYP